MLLQGWVEAWASWCWHLVFLSTQNRIFRLFHIEWHVRLHCQMQKYVPFCHPHEPYICTAEAIMSKNCSEREWGWTSVWIWYSYNFKQELITVCVFVCVSHFCVLACVPMCGCKRWLPQLLSTFLSVCFETVLSMNLDFTNVVRLTGNQSSEISGCSC